MQHCFFFVSIPRARRNSVLCSNYHTSLSINFRWHLWLFGTHSPVNLSIFIGYCHCEIAVCSRAHKIVPQTRSTTGFSFLLAIAFFVLLLKIQQFECGSKVCFVVFTVIHTDSFVRIWKLFVDCMH